MTDATSTAPIAFIDLQAQRARIDSELRARMDAVLAHGRYILGPEVGELEERLAAFAGVDNVVACANGTDALVLAMRALGVQPGQAVLVPSFTFCATAEAVVLCGAVPVFIDVDAATFNIDADSFRTGVAHCVDNGHDLAGVIAVDLFGQPAPYDELHEAAAGHGVWVIADAAQSVGANVRGQRVGSLAPVTTASFFPAKPLGCYGDGGAVFATDPEIAATMRSLCMHGQGANQYDSVRIGYNSRLDTLQAAILLAKLDIFEDELQRRDAIARRYSQMLADVAGVPHVAAGVLSAWAQYTLTLEHGQRDRVIADLRGVGIPSAIYYPRPLHRQVAYESYPVAGGELPVSDDVSRRVLSLPMHPYLESAVQDRIAEQVRSSLQRG